MKIVALSLGLVLASAAVQAASDVAPAYDKTFVTKHTDVFGKTKMSYTATVTSTLVPDDSGKPAANFVTTTYIRDDVKDRAKRPVIFDWDGGPSIAPITDHTRILGPKRLLDPAPGHEAEGQTIINNPDWLLDVADIVIIDTPETGFSRVLPGGNRAYFYGVAGDTKSIEQFMDIWLKAHGREASPRYIFGGSYGSVRAARIGWDLRNSAHPVDGIIIPANCTMLRNGDDIVAPVLSLPSTQIRAVYQGKVPRNGMTDAQIIDDAYKFALNEWMPALVTIQDLTPDQRSAMAAKLAARTGIGTDVYLAHDLTTRGYRPQGAAPATQTAATPSVPPLFLKYLKDDLKITYPMSEYREIAPDSNETWNYDGPKEARLPNGRNDWPKMLSETMAADPHVRLYSANGYDDSQCPIGQARYLFSRTKLPHDRVVVKEYPGPHGLYRNPETAVHMANDIRAMMAANGDIPRQ